MTIENKNPTADMNNLHQNEVCGTESGENNATANNNNNSNVNLTCVGTDRGTIKQRACEENQESNKIVTGGTSEQADSQDTKTVATTSYLGQDCVVIVIMASSMDKDITITSIQKFGYTLLEQHTLQLTAKQINTLYAYNKSDTKPHYQKIYDGWKESSLRNPVQVVILGKENAVQSFQDLMKEQNSTKKKDRILDTESVYASTTEDNVKRDIELLLGTQESNNLGDLVSSATAGDNQDDTVTQTPVETEGGLLEKIISTEKSNHQPTTLSHENESSSDTNSVNMTKSISDISISKQQQQQQRPNMMTMAATTVTSTTMVTATFDVASPIETQPLKPPPQTALSLKKDPIALTSAPLNDQTIEDQPLPSSKIEVFADNEEYNKQLVDQSITKTDPSQLQNLEQSPSKSSNNIVTETELTEESSPSFVTSANTTTTRTEASKEPLPSSTAPPTDAPTVEPASTVPSVNTDTTITTTKETLLVVSEITAPTTESTIEPLSPVQSVNRESPPTPASSEESNNSVNHGKCSNNGSSSVSYSASADNSDADVQQQQSMDSATKTKSSAKFDAVTRQESRNALHSKKIAQQSKESAVRPAAKKAVATTTETTSKVNNKTTQPALPIKSKLRRTAPPTKTTTTIASIENTPNKQQQPKPSSNTANISKKSTDETKKKVPRVPRVALLANQTKATSTDEQPKTKPPTTSKISRDAIARLTAPTASSARRRQGASTEPSPPSTPTRGTSVTATFKVEQRKRRLEPVSSVKSSTVKTTATTATKQPSPTSTSRLAKQTVTKKKPNDVGTATAKKSETPPQKVAKKPLVPKRREPTASAATEKPLTAIDTSTSLNSGSGKETIAAADAEKAVDDTAIPSPSATGNPKQTQQDNNNKHSTEPSPLSPADSSSTSSRPQTPDHSLQDRSTTGHTTTTTTTTVATTAPTTGVVTLDNVNATSIKTLDHHHQQQKPPVTTSKVKDMLRQFNM